LDWNTLTGANRGSRTALSPKFRIVLTAVKAKTAGSAYLFKVSSSVAPMSEKWRRALADQSDFTRAINI
jgi:hypothetical protein